MARASSVPESSDGIAPLSQKQEDLLIELFIRLSVSDRKKVIKFCRDLRKAKPRKEK